MSLIDFFEDGVEQRAPESSSSKIESQISQVAGRLTSYIENPMNQLSLISRETLEELTLSIHQQCLTLSKSVGYVYDLDDYQSRLATCDDQLQTCFRERVLSNPEIKRLYCQLKNILGDLMNHPILSQRVFEEYFEDVTLESLPSTEYGEIESLNTNAFINGPTREKTIALLQDWTSLDLSNQLIAMMQTNELRQIFECLRHIRCLNLKNNVMDILSKEELESIFGQLGNLRYLNLSSNSMGTYTQSQLGSIFENLPHLKALHLGSTNLGKLNPQSLEYLFWSCRNLKVLHLGGNHFNNEDEAQLTTLFSHLSQLKSLTLTNTRLYGIFPSQLKSIFSNLGHLQSLTLGADDLENIGDKQIKSIFESLSQVEEIRIQNTSHETRMRIYKNCPNLKKLISN